MNKTLQIKLSIIEENYISIQKELSSSEISQEKRIELSKKFSSIEQILKKKKSLKILKKT